MHFFEKYNIPIPEVKDHDWYNSVVPEQLMNLFETDAANDKFDAILVDEGQDFSLEFWLSLKTLLKDDFKVFHVAIDPSQQARFNTDSVEVDDIFGEINYSPMMLQYNWRNTKRIADYANKIARELDCKTKVHGTEYSLPALTPREEYPNGEKVFEIQVKDKDELAKEIEKILSDLIINCKIPKDEITILSGNGIRTLSSNDGPVKFGQKLGKYTLAQFPKDNKEIQLETVRRYKGRENLVIVLIDDEALNPNLKYIGATRANGLLYVIGVKG